MYVILEFNNRVVERKYEIMYISDPPLMLPSFNECACSNQLESITVLSSETMIKCLLVI